CEVDGLHASSSSPLPCSLSPLPCSPSPLPCSPSPLPYSPSPLPPALLSSPLLSLSSPLLSLSSPLLSLSPPLLSLSSPLLSLSSHLLSLSSPLLFLSSPQPSPTRTASPSKQARWARSTLPFTARGRHGHQGEQHGVVGEVDEAPYGTQDGIAIRASSMVWVDHCLVHNTPMGTIDLLASSDAHRPPTIQRAPARIQARAQARVGSGVPESLMRLGLRTFGNFFEGPSAPMLHCQASLCHVANNLFANWTDTCIVARGGASVRSLNNVYASTVPGAAGIVTANADGASYFVTSGDLLRNGVRFVVSLPPGVSGSAGMPPLPYSLPVDKADSSLPGAIKGNSGPQF
ncbi:unnamed protein product, partial [Closterium sp. NIES-64]